MHRMMLALAGLLCVAAGAEAPAPAPVSIPAKELIELGQRVEERVTKVRGLPLKKKLRWEVTSKEKVKAYLLQTLRQQYAPGELEKEGRAMQALGLIPRDLDYAGFVVALYEEQVGGYYDPKLETFFLADWIAPSLQESIIAHEMTHALDDQHFQIDAFIDRIKGNSDAMNARSALEEGSAMLVMLLDASQQMGMTLDPALLDPDGPMGQMLMGLSAGQYPKFAEAPRALRESLMFPYLRGLRFVSEGRKRGGWARVDAIYKDLPRTTEQVLHPEKYFDQRDDPEVVTLRFLDASAPTGWEFIYEDTLGEFTTQLLLDPIANREEEKRAAAGWDGDKLRVYAKGAELAWVQLSRWDTENDAVEYAGALAKTVDKRVKGAVLQPVKAGQTRMSWTVGAGRVVQVERRGQTVLVVENLEPEAVEKIRSQAFGSAP